MSNLFDRYSWWDLLIVGGVITALYYAYIAVVYYREDIREWISNKGSRAPATAATVEEPENEPEDEPALYSVHTYGQSAPVPNQPAVAATSPAPTPSRQPTEPVVSDVDLNGAVFDEQEQNNFDLPLNGSVHRQTEERVDEMLNVATRIHKEEDGTARANDEQDKPAVRIASMINYQTGQAAFADIFSNR